VSVGEHAFLGFLLLGIVVAFFGLALPGYKLIRKIWPESGWNLGGSVSTSAIRAFDLLVLVGLCVLYFTVWKGYPDSAEKILEATPELFLSSSLSMLVLASLVPLLLFWRVNLAEFFGLRWLEWRKVIWIAPVFVVVVFLLNIVLYFTGWQEWVQVRFGSDAQDTVQLLTKTDDWWLIGAAAFSAVIAAPIAEEVIFRGYIYPVVKCFSEKWFAALFSGLLFGVVHFNLMSFPILVLMGIGFVILYEWTGSIWPSIACHLLFNATTISIILLGRLATP